MVLPKGMSESRSDSPIEPESAGITPSGENHGDRSLRSSLGGSDDNSLVIRLTTARRVIQELIEAAQVRKWHLNVRRDRQLRRPRRQTTWLRLLGCQGERLLNHSFSAGELRATA